MSGSAAFLPNERFRIGAGKAMGIVSVTLGVYSIAAILVVGFFEFLTRDYVLHQALPAIGFGVFALLALPRQPFNNSVWVAAWGGLACGIAAAGYTTSVVILIGNGFEADMERLAVLTPADMPAAAAVSYSLIGFVLFGYILILTVGLLLFPDGRFQSPRWRWVSWASLLTSFGFVVAIADAFRPSSTTRVGSDSDQWEGLGRFVDELTAVAMGLAVVALASLVIRYRRSEGLARQQYRWIALGGGFFILVLAAIVVAPGPMVPDMDTDVRSSLQVGATLLGLVAVLGAYAIAVGKYRLYEIDVVISRTLVYGALAAFIGAVYVGIVVGVGYVIGAQDAPNTWLGMVATVIIALAFQPLRRQLQRLANRIVYGRRATPYEVLSTFSQGISAVDPSVLTQLAKSLAEGTTAQTASIWIDRSDRLQCIAAWPEIPDVEPHTGVSAPVLHDGEELGRVTLEIPPGQPFPVTDRRLLDQVAAGLGLALRNLLLTEDLRIRVDELAASRRRIVSVQDETRRKLERDLHDGAQQRLVALKIKLGIGSALAEKVGLDDVRTMIDTVREDTDHTIDSVRDFARGIYPPLLEAEGLGHALKAQVRRMPISVTVQAVGLGRYPKDQEATVYFCVLEALQNAMKHSEASSVQVVLSEPDDKLSFEIRDDGVGFDETAIDPDGLLNMKDRVEAVGGLFSVESAPGQGTIVRGAVPVPALVGS